ncbi:MAG: GNAT family N-acetyltransferase [Anaerolineae bacterium]|nr:GNAT family N-acetyltransferase [Anaerolineae bacterium]MDQ7037121.1 GNAT family N-acetyltransferase [Anaerolineae bacterium]
MTSFTVALSALDEARFGICTAKANNITHENLVELGDFCKSNAVELAIARVNVQNLDAIQMMEADGYRLMDTLVYYAFKFPKKSIPKNTSNHHLRLCNPDDTEAIATLATDSFKGYYGHYHADSRLDNALCDAVYIDWAKNSVSSQLADAVYVLEGDKGLDAFATLRTNSEDEGEGVLFGVAPHAQGQGIYRALMIQGMIWCLEQGTQRMVVSTQITNVAVQKVWARLGFEFDRAYYTLHKWFDS